MKKEIFIVGLILMIFNSCSNEQDVTNFQAISNFNLDTLTPIIDEKIRLVYCSNVEDSNPTRGYLIQFVAVMVETGDTINVISDHSEHINNGDANKIYLLNRRTLSDFNIQPNIDNEVYETMKESGTDIKAMVISDPKFDKMENNNHRTIIGEISKE